MYWIVLRMFYFLSTVMLTTFTLNLPHPKGDICKKIAQCVCVIILPQFCCRYWQHDFRLVFMLTVNHGYHKVGCYCSYEYKVFMMNKSSHISNSTT